MSRCSHQAKWRQESHRRAGESAANRDTEEDEGCRSARTGAILTRLRVTSFSLTRTLETVPAPRSQHAPRADDRDRRSACAWLHAEDHPASLTPTAVAAIPLTRILRGRSRRAPAGDLGPRYDVGFADGRPT